MRLRRHFDTEETHGIDLAPMLDFVLNLLIFFIITAVFIKEIGITVSRPTAQAEKKQDEKGAILILLRASGEIVMDNRVVDVRAVRANIERLHAEKPDAPVIVAASRESETGVLVQVIDQARQGGVENVSIAPLGQ